MIVYFGCFYCNSGDNRGSFFSVTYGNSIYIFVFLYGFFIWYKIFSFEEFKNEEFVPLADSSCFFHSGSFSSIRLSWLTRLESFFGFIRECLFKACSILFTSFFVFMSSPFLWICRIFNLYTLSSFLNLF